jgi:hypothetical protein
MYDHCNTNTEPNHNLNTYYKQEQLLTSQSNLDKDLKQFAVHFRVLVVASIHDSLA